MWGSPLTIVMLTAALAVVGYIALWASRLDTHLGALLQEQSEERRRVEREVARLRASLLVESGQGPFDNARQKAWLLPRYRRTRLLTSSNRWLGTP
jgi:hypothetical protein